MVGQDDTKLTKTIKGIIDCRELFTHEFPEHYRENGNSLCPWHHDTTPSLEVKKEVVFCFGGCSVNGKPKPYDCFDILKKSRALTFPQARELLAERYSIAIEEPTPRKVSPDVVYDYCDENGTLLFQVCRYPGKQFRQRRPDPDKPGEWIWSLDCRPDVNYPRKMIPLETPTRRVLFGLPELLNADPEPPVLVCEGEKDCLAAREIGFVTTCNPGGAGKWPALCERWKLHESLRNLIVWVIPDNDEPGRAHAEDVARSLAGIARSVKILTLPGVPENGDLSDFIEAQGPEAVKRHLLELAARTAEHIPLPQRDNEQTPFREVIKAAFPRLEAKDPSLLEDQDFLDAMRGARKRAPALHETALRAVKGMRRDLERVIKFHESKDEAAERGHELQYTALAPGLVDVIEYGGAPAFLICTEEGLKIAARIECDGVIYSPPPLDQIPEPVPRGQAVADLFQLESSLTIRQADGALLDDLVAHFRRISDLPTERHYLLLSLWALHTYLADQFEYSPVLCFYAVPERGKTRTGKGLIYVCYRGLHTVTVREAYLLRFAHNQGGTIFFDVRDLWTKAEKAGTDDLLLGRFEKGFKAVRVLYPDRGPFKDTVLYTIYGPTIIATNEPIHKILGTRAISITMPESTRYFTDDVTPEAALPLKERCLAFRARHLGKKLPDVDKIAPGRLGDILRPLHQIVRLVCPDRESTFRALVKDFEKERRADKRDSLEGRVVSLLLDLSQKNGRDGGPLLKHGMIEISEIVNALNEGVPENRRLSATRIGRAIKSLGLDTGKVHGGRSAVIWDETKLARIAQPYGLKTTSPGSPISPGEDM